MSHLYLSPRLFNEIQTQTTSSLTIAEELDLFDQYQKGCQKAFSKLLIEHQYVAYQTAKNIIINKSLKIDIMVLFQEGMYEMYLKLKYYNPSRGYRISTYLQKVIYHALIKYSERNTNHLKMHRYFDDPEAHDLRALTKSQFYGHFYERLKIQLKDKFSENQLDILYQKLKGRKFTEMAQDTEPYDRKKLSAIYHKTIKKLKEYLYENIKNSNEKM